MQRIAATARVAGKASPVGHDLKLHEYETGSAANAGSNCTPIVQQGPWWLSISTGIGYLWWFTLADSMRSAICHSFLVSAALATCLGAFAQQSTPPASTDSKPVQKPTEELPDSPAPQAAALIHPNGPMAVFDTSMGRITCQFYQAQAPKTVANFIGLAEGTKDWTDPGSHKKMHAKRYYDGTTFHRVIPDFMIQGGDPTGTGMGDPGFQFEDEFDPNLNFDAPGRLAMANSGPNTDGSQFFITEQAYDSLSQHYTVFGQCDQNGVEVVKAIARVQRDSQDKPLTPVVLRKVTIVRDGAPIPPLPSASATQDAKPAAQQQ